MSSLYSFLASLCPVCSTGGLPSARHPAFPDCPLCPSSANIPSPCAQSAADPTDDIALSCTLAREDDIALARFEDDGGFVPPDTLPRRAQSPAYLSLPNVLGDDVVPFLPVPDGWAQTEGGAPLYRLCAHRYDRLPVTLDFSTERALVCALSRFAMFGYSLSTVLL